MMLLAPDHIIENREGPLWVHLLGKHVIPVIPDEA